MKRLKKIVGDFIKKRPNDLISITIFGTDAALIVVPTMETKLLEKSLERIQSSQAGYQTSIGEGLFTSIAALFEKQMGKRFTIKELRDSINKQHLTDYAISFVKEMERRDVVKTNSLSCLRMAYIISVYRRTDPATAASDGDKGVRRGRQGVRRYRRGLGGCSAAYRGN